VLELLTLCERLRLGLGVLLAHTVALLQRVPLAVRLAHLVAVGEGEAEARTERLRVGEGEVERLRVGEVLVEALPVGRALLRVGEGGAVRVVEAEPEAQAEAEGLPLGEGVAEAQAEAEGLREGLCVPEGVRVARDCVAEALTQREREGVGEVVPEAHAVAAAAGCRRRSKGTPEKKLAQRGPGGLRAIASIKRSHMPLAGVEK
jgi:hypothetical protein